MGRPQNLKARDGILDAATDLIHADGYRGVSMDDVARKAGLRKSNLFHYYPTKEGLVLAVLRRAAGAARAQIERDCAGAGDPVRMIEALFSRLAAGMERGGCARGCLIGNLAEEMSDQREKVRRSVSGHLAFWTDSLASFFKRHKDAGYFRKDFNPEAAGAAVVALIEGATLLAKAARSAEPLRQSGRVAAAYLKAEKEKAR